LLPCPAIADKIYGRVVGVSDGDTITVLDAARRQYKIRLNGIDAPESDQDFGQASKRNLSDLVFGKDVIVIWNKRDRYGRILGKVVVGDREINLTQIRDGYSWFFRKYAADIEPADRHIYDEAEKEARSALRGLWQQPNPMPPWEFREKQRGQHQGPHLMDLVL
jgi:endonuclease YncB( thermonuclease family)